MLNFLSAGTLPVTYDIKTLKSSVHQHYFLFSLSPLYIFLVETQCNTLIWPIPLVLVVHKNCKIYVKNCFSVGVMFYLELLFILCGLNYSLFCSGIKLLRPDVVFFCPQPIYVCIMRILQDAVKCQYC